MSGFCSSQKLALNTLLSSRCGKSAGSSIEATNLFLFNFLREVFLKNINMKVEIQRLNADPANTMLEVYCDNNRPLCKIWEEDFIELLTDKQTELLEKGKIRFDVNRMELLVKSKQWFG